MVAIASSSVWTDSEQTWPTWMGALKLRRIAVRATASRVRDDAIAGFVQMQVQGQTAVFGQGEKAVEQGLEFGGCCLAAFARGGHAQDAAGMPRPRWPGRCHRRRRNVPAGRCETACNVDAAGPGIAQAAEHGPVRVGVRPVAVQMGADRRGAMGMGAAQAEFEAGLDVGFAVVAWRGRR